MKEKYSIGQYELATYEEYLDGLDDVKKIKGIIHEVDIFDEDAALRLYKLLRQKKITFKGKVGNGFFIYVSDIVAHNSQELTLKEYEGSLGVVQNSKARLGTGIALIVLAGVLAVVFAFQQYKSNASAEEIKELQNQRSEAREAYADSYVAPFAIEDESTQHENDAAEINGSQEVLPDNGGSLSIIPEFQELYDLNDDLIGWIEILNTDINYPVMQIVGDNSYYLKHDFYKKEDNNGSLFLDGRSGFYPGQRDDNLIIYGHNMRSGAMFGSLKDYLDWDFYKKHKKISFDTIYEKANYEVVGVGLSEVEYQDSDSFRYYDFLDVDSEEEFDKIISKLNKLSAFGDLDVKYGDQLLTLSTCNSYIEDGRLFVIAKRIN